MSHYFFRFYMFPIENNTRYNFCLFNILQFERDCKKAKLDQHKNYHSNSKLAEWLYKSFDVPVHLYLPLPFCLGASPLSEAAGTKSGWLWLWAPLSQSVWICWTSGTLKFWMFSVWAVCTESGSLSAIFCHRAEFWRMIHYQLCLTPLSWRVHCLLMKRYNI